MTDTRYTVNNVQEVDSPSLLVYVDQVQKNISILKTFIQDVSQLRPHVKTHKSSEITTLMLQAGITKFKCATIAEAEMLSMANGHDILLAYQPVGPAVNRLVALVTKYPQSTFSCLIDNVESAIFIAETFHRSGLTLNVFIDLNVGMNRTGITPALACKLYYDCQTLKGLTIIGLHAYDGHLRDADLAIRAKQCDEAFAPVDALRKKIEQETGKTLIVIAGGTPTFPIHAKRSGVECSPGTFIYWDKGYQSILAEQPFQFAALVITRVISKPTPNTICIDLGHKAIASEGPLEKRVIFLNAPDLQPVGHSEEHMVLHTDNAHAYRVGDILYGIPYHICPTVALHDRVHVVINNQVTGQWITLARNRKITV